MMCRLTRQAVCKENAVPWFAFTSNGNAGNCIRTPSDSEVLVTDTQFHDFTELNPR